MRITIINSCLYKKPIKNYYNVIRRVGIIHIFK